MTKNIRRQLTLFVDPKDAQTIEEVRQEFNPVQFELIKSHVTLCREDEILNLEQVISNLLDLKQTGIVIGFGNVTSFDNGQGILLPATNDNAGFQELRRKVLHGLTGNLEKQEPHITLMHPRNSTCTNQIFKKIQKLSLPAKLAFKKISLIEQEDDGKWKVLQEFPLNEKS